MLKITFLLVFISIIFLKCEKQDTQKIEDIWVRVDTQDPPNDSIAEYWQFTNNTLLIERFDLRYIPTTNYYKANFRIQNNITNKKLIITDSEFQQYNGEWTFYTFKNDMFAIYQFTYNDFFYLDFKQLKK